MAEIKLKSKTLDDVKEYIKSIVSFNVDEDYYKDDEKLEEVVENYKEIYFFDDPTLRKFLKKLLAATEELAQEYNLLPEEPEEESEEEESEEEESEEEKEEKEEEETKEEPEDEESEVEETEEETEEKKAEAVDYLKLTRRANSFLDY